MVRSCIVCLVVSLIMGCLPLPPLVNGQTTGDVASPRRPPPAAKRPASAPQSQTAAKPQPVSAMGPVLFENTIGRSGINFVLKNSVTPIKYSIETMMGGAAAFDYDNDGYLDIYFPNGATIPGMDKSDPDYFNRLYHSNHDGTFTDVTEKAGLKGIAYCMGVAAGDYDNDGFVDLYVCGYNHNQLFHNNGDGTFTDVTEKAKVAGTVPKHGKVWAITAGWIDYNNDGLLDLFINSYLNYSIETAPHCTLQGIAAYCSPNNFEGLPNILYRNNGDGTFTDASEESGIAKHAGKGMGIALADYDNDGFTDIFVSNDTFRNFLFHNDGNGKFSEVAILSGVAFNEMGRTVAGMGADFRDLNNDGKPEILHTAMFGDTFPLYKNLGDQFEEVTSMSGLTIQTSRLTAWGTGIFDFDNDGYKDLFTADAAILDNSMEIEHRPYELPNSLFRNNGNMTFKDIGPLAGPDFNVPMAHRGTAFGDFDNDGQIDAVVVVLNAKPQILMNRTRNGNHWLTIQLIGTKSNRDGLGARIQVVTAGITQYNHATTAGSYNSSSDKRVHFGLGTATRADKIEVRWPSGIVQTLTDVKSDQFLTVKEPDGNPGK
jgi:hypothetical protein